jgi:integrase
MDHRYVVRFARDDPETPPTRDEQLALARQAARKLGIPNAESQPTYRVGRNSNTVEDRLASLWTLAATSGARRGELLGARWADLDLDADPPTLTIRQTLLNYGKLTVIKEPKTERSRRVIPLPARTVAALRSHRKAQAAERLAAGAAYTDNGLVFTDEIGRPLAPPAITAAFRRIVRDEGLPPLTLHGLRHTWASVALDEGVDVLYVAELLGHSSPAITQSIYQHARPERTVESVERVSAAFS